MGQIVMQHTNCNTTCPHANFENNVYSISCGGKELIFEIEKEEEKAKTMFSVD